MLKKIVIKIFSYLDSNRDLFFIYNNYFRFRKFAELSGDSMSGSELSRKLELECKSKDVLEFGSGGSTLLFAKFARRVVSVESDKQFLNHVQTSLERSNLDNNVKLIYANIGLIKSFGQPIQIFRYFYKSRYKSYTTVCFDQIESDFKPEIVFIDGRFRAWCAIQSALKIQNDFMIIFDDYFDRGEYHLIESVLGSPKRYCGNTAIFNIERSVIQYNFDLGKLEFDYR